MIKFPKIRQFRDIIKTVREHHDFQGLTEDKTPIFEHTSEYPTLSFTGTVKIHGTNSSIVIRNDIQYQSRNRIITVGSDNAGFASFADKTNDRIDLKKYFGDNVVIFGEWCGQGIQRGVAVSELPRMFVVFEVYSIASDEIVSEQDINMNESQIKELNEAKIFFINQFPTFSLDVDFNHPEIAHDKIVTLVNQVETQCPVGAFFNVFGVGEGIVWKCVENTSSDLWMKTKGGKHAVSKTKTIAPIDVETMHSINEFVESTVTENRLNQGIEYVKEQGLSIERKNTSVFIKWVVKDIETEESDTLEESGLSSKDVNKHISNKSRKFWFNACDSF